MSSILNIERLCMLLMLGCLPALAQSGYVAITAPAGKVLVNGQMQLTATITDLAGTPLDSSGLTWTASDNSLATIASDGTLSGIFPGDVFITAADSNTGASAVMQVHVVPRSISIQATLQQVRVGDSTQFSATAFDAANKPIAGVQFQFRSGEPAIAGITSNGLLNGVSEGFTTIEARIPSVSNDAALAVTLQVHVLPQALYKIRKIFSTDVTSNTTFGAFGPVSAVSASEIAGIVTLANGNQAAILLESGTPKVLAVGGQVLPNAQRMVLRIDAISANSRGDVALLIEYPTQWCTASVIFFPHGQPEQEIAGANCGNGLNARSLAEDGSFLYRYNDQVFTASLTRAPTLLFSIATQPTAKDPVRGVNDFYPSRAGTFILNTTLTSGTHAYLYFDGKTLTKVYQDGDPLGLSASNNIDSVIGSSDGTFYGRINGNGYAALIRLAPGPMKPMVQNGDSVNGGTVGWVQGVTDAGAAGVLMMVDLAVGPYHTSVCVWDGKKLVEYAQADGYAAMISGAMLSSGTALVYASVFDSNTIAGLRTITSTGAQTLLLAAGTPFPQPVPAGVDWHYASRGGSPTAIPVRAAGDAVVSAGDSVQMIAGLGTKFATGKIITWVGGAIANESGDILFTAGYPTGNALLRYRGGKLDVPLDTGVQGSGPAGTNLNGLRSDRGRYIAMNNRGDFVVDAPFGGLWQLVEYTADGAPHLIVQQGGAAPGGSAFTNNFQNLAIDDGGRVLFTCVTADGLAKVFFWDGKTVQRVIGLGDVGPNSYTLNEVSNIAGAGSGFILVLAFGSYQTRELRYFDGVQMKVLQSTDTALFDGTGLSYYWTNECTLAANGDAHCMAQTQDGGTGVYAHRGARDVIVARSRDQLPGGEWLLMPLSVSSSMNGEVYFTADVFLNGVEALALYEAVPQ